MMGLPFIFLHPWVLAGFIALPAFWLILRLLPPAPKKIFLPTARFLLGINSKQMTPDLAPWWLILMRLSILACLILAFASPVLHPRKIENKTGPLNLIFDNGWASTQTWSLQMQKAEEILDMARASGRLVHLQFTASDNSPGFTRADEALSRLHSGQPQSWPGNLFALKNNDKAETIWISSGLAENGFSKAAENFAAHGLTIYLPDLKDRPGIVHGGAPENLKALIRIEIPAGSGNRNLNIQALDSHANIMTRLRKTVSGQTGGEDLIDETFSDRKISRWQVKNFSGAGGIYLNDTAHGSGLIGIVSGNNLGAQDNFSNAAFYLSRAIETFAKSEQGSITDLIKKDCTVIVLPDVTGFSPDNLTALQTFLDKGGVILRFGGKNMSEADNVLIPVALKTGLRSLSGDMTWTTPLKLTAFAKTSPFAAETMPDISVERQLLAEPSADLENHVWATLSDGTPFITARGQGRGLLILVHTTATPEWSDFVLSGFYVKFLKEVLELSSLPDKSKTGDTILQPSLVLDGWGQLVAPSADVKPIVKSQLEKTIPDKNHPPGYYGDTNKKIPLNLGDRIESLDVVDHLPAGAKSESLTVLSKERKLASIFFALAAILFLLDWLILLSLPRFRAFKLIILLGLFFTVPAHAGSDIDRASLIHLACIHTSADKTCVTALDHVAQTLKSRTSVEIGDSVIVDPGRDELSFYPILYWPVDTDTPIAPTARSALSSYLTKGGMILIDTRDGAYTSNQIVPSLAVSYLREQLQGIEISSLKPIARNHVLFKSFYLLNLYPEYDLTGKIWVADDSMPPDENLSPVMITGEDWLNKWAYSTNRSGDEMADRFGVNLVIYALTGNYKSDQVHMKAILQRMAP